MLNRFYSKNEKAIESISSWCNIGIRKCDLRCRLLPCSLFRSQNQTLVQNPSAVTHNTVASKHCMVLHACVCRLYARSNSVLFVARMETLIPMSVPWTQPRVKEVRLLLCRVKESASRTTKVSPARFSFSFVFCYCEEDLFVYQTNLCAEHIFL